MSHCYGYNSMSEMLEAERRKHEDDVIHQEMKRLKERIVELEAQKADLKKRLDATYLSVAELRRELLSEMGECCYGCQRM